MSNTRRLVYQLATEPGIKRAVHNVASQIADTAQSLDDEGNYKVIDTTLNVNGLVRNVIAVVDEGPVAVDREFGNGRTPARRTLGRAAGARSDRSDNPTDESFDDDDRTA